MKRSRWRERALNFLSALGGGSFSLLFGSLSVVALICAARILGLWEGIELQTLDLLLRYRPLEAVDERITIVEVTDADLQALGTYPVPDDVMVRLLETLTRSNPSVIGLDIFRDLPVANPTADVQSAKLAHDSLISLLATTSDVVVIEKILDPPVSAPMGVPSENVGFADALLDSDGFVRRSLLASPSDANPEDYHLSFTIQVAAKYLERRGYELENGVIDPAAMRFGQTELFRVREDSGGYWHQDTGGNPVVLLNFRQHPMPFRRISLMQLLSEEFEADWIKDRVVLVGMTAVSTKDYVNSAALIAPSRGGQLSHNPGLVPGVEFQAHAIGQILSAVLDGRPILRPWTSDWEYVWIIACGLAGLGLVHLRRPVSTVAIAFILLGGVPLLLPASLILKGVWIPVFPAWLGYTLTGGSVLVYRLHQYEQGRKIRFQARQQILERSYNAIHNGPLQTLKSLIRQVSSQENSQVGTNGSELHQWIGELNKVDSELRSIYEFMQREYLQKEISARESQIYLTQNYVIDLTGPLHELLHQVYQNKLQESATYFETVKVKISDFCPMDDARLNTALKENILRFFEEALCNVEQHAVGVTRLQVICKQVDNENVIRVVDNGRFADGAVGDVVESEAAMKRAVSKRGGKGGDGSRQANSLARRLGGQFSRHVNGLRGTVCEIVWPIQPKSFLRRHS